MLLFLPVLSQENGETLPSNKPNVDSNSTIETDTNKATNTNNATDAKDATDANKVTDPAKEVKPETPKNTIPKKKGILMKPDDPEDMKRWAIVIGVNDYNDLAIGKLSKARNDAKIIGQILTDQGEFTKVFVMTDDLDAKDPLYPTRINIEEKLDNVLSFAGPDDMILFFFSGHGISDPDGGGYILPVDTVLEKPLYTSVRIGALTEKIAQKKIKKSLLLLDACRDTVSSTKAAASKVGLQSDKFENAEVAATFFSTKSGYYSFEDPKSDFGVFTKYLAYGMEGQADTDNDEIVSFSELEVFVQNGVSAWSLDNGKQQKPFVKYYNEKYGDLPITVKGVREKSRVDSNDFNKSDSRLPFVLRSAVIPGWGQWESGSRPKGAIYFSASLGFVGYFASSYGKLKSAQSSYNSAFSIPGTMFLPTYMNVQSKHSQLVSAEGRAQTAYILLLGAWLWNVFDAGVLTKSEKPKPTVSFDFRKEYVPSQGFAQSLIESKATVEISFEF